MFKTNHCIMLLFCDSLTFTNR